ncbi:MAG: hypothetical protein K6T55_07480 [Syntrophobacterales bacterium]|nr:hypothetical protein [Syntrophobacterales bacterium]
MTEAKSLLEMRSWDILKEPNRILLEEDYSRMELLIYFLTWTVEIGLALVLAVTYLRG